MRKIFSWKFWILLCFSLVTVSYVFPPYLQPVTAQRIPQPQIQALEPSLDNPEIYSFVKEGFDYAVELYGQPRISVNKVNLQLNSRPLTTLNNREDGIFTIYVNRPSEYAFYGQLSHEIGHLLNAQLLDCYVEGMHTVLAEKMLKRKGLDWSGWESYFRQGYEPFHGLTYFMMKEVTEVAGRANMQRLLNFAVYNDESQQWMHVDIDGWLSAMSDYVRTEVKKVINKHITTVRETVKSTYPSYSCREPN